MKELEALKKAADTRETYCAVDSAILIAVCGKLTGNKTAERILAIAKGSSQYGGKSMMIPTEFAKQFLAEATSGGAPLKQ